MLELETFSGTRRETIEELSGLLFVVQDMGRRLADDTHGEAYESIRNLNDLLHQARAALMLIKQAP